MTEPLISGQTCVYAMYGTAVGTVVMACICIAVRMVRERFFK